MARASSGAGASGVLARLSALRNAERCARFLTVAARVFRMFFLADAIFGTGTPSVQRSSVEKTILGEYET